MKAVKRIVVLGATAGLLIAGAGAAEANAGHDHGKSEKKHSKHDKHGKKHYGKKHHGKKHQGKKDGKKVVVVNKNSGAQAFVIGHEGVLSGSIVQTVTRSQINDCGGSILSAGSFQNASINNNCVNVTNR